MDFKQLLTSALGDPGRQADPADMSGLMGAVRQATGQQGLSPAIAPALLSTVGSYVRSALRDHRSTQGPAETEAIVDRFSGTQPNPQAVDSLFPPQERARVERSVSQETGLQPNVVASLLPVLVPVVLKFLQGGRATQGTGASGNTLLSSFMDADRDGDVDIGDALQMAQGFLRR